MYIFIINPIAGNGRGNKVFQRLKKLDLYRTLEREEHITMYKGHAKKIAQEIITSTEKITAIIVIGGDGTLNEVVNGISRSGKLVPISFIPAGSGNDFRRGANLPQNPTTILKNILTQKEERSYWYGNCEINNEIISFVNCVGVGFDAVVADQANRSIFKKILNKIGLGKFVYVIALIYELIFYRPLSVKVKIDGKLQIFEQCFLLTVSNQPYFGGGMKINPYANNNQNHFSLLVVDRISKWKVLFLFITVFFGKHIHFKEVNILSGKNIQIEPSEVATFQIDGEIKRIDYCIIKKQPFPLKVKGY